jgi:hypothetical protein
MTKYEKLTADLKAAYKTALIACKDTDEGGTMNFDAPGLWLPRWNTRQTEAAVKAAGFGAIKFDERFLGKPGFYTISVNFGGVGNLKSKGAEAMTAALAALGYDTFFYCASD